MAAQRPPLSAVLPPLILGTATFNTQHVEDPSRMPSGEIVARALELGITAFDTSPYYGPSETLLGKALAPLIRREDPGSSLAANPAADHGTNEGYNGSESSPATNGDAHHPNGLRNGTSAETSPGIPRSSVFLITKAGRNGHVSFDYSPVAIRASVYRSLARLRTPYLDLVYTHDVEFVSPAEVVAAVRELRRLRDEGVVRYVGISGYPVDWLCELAELVVRETGEPLDAVMSYCHCTLQNAVLASAGPLDRLRAAGVSVVPSASMLGMGLLTSRGVDDGLQAAWHPAPSPLRQACKAAGVAAAEAGHRLERIALRWALDEWSRVCGEAGLGTATGTTVLDSDGGDLSGVALGPSVMGVTTVAELEETWAVWVSVLEGLGLAPASSSASSFSPSSSSAEREVRKVASLKARERVRTLVEEKLWPLLGSWRDYSWESPSAGFVNEKAVLEDE